MKKIAILLLAIINILPAFAGDIETKDIKLFREGERVVLSFSAYIPEGTVRADRRLLVTPQLYNDKGTVAMELFTITGKRLEKRDKQRLRLDKKRTASGYANTTNGSTMLYTASVPYEPWMASALSVHLQIGEEGCCSIEEMRTLAATGPIILSVPYVPSIPEILARPSEVTRKRTDYPFLRLVDKDHSGERSTSVRFRVASSVLDLRFSSNAANVNKIVEGIGLINSDPRTSLEKITIVGFASPEGNKQQNMRLAENRAKALSRYLQQEMNIPEKIFDIQSGGEDWDGLLELIKQSDMQYKDEVIKIITDTAPEKRNEQLKQLRGGRPYQSMYDVIYPQLRDACYINVWYSEIKDGAAEAINDAIALIAALRYDEALESLRAVEDDPRSWNAIGTCYLLQGDYSQARVWLKKAAEAGDKEAEKNLDLINTK